MEDITCTLVAPDGFSIGVSFTINVEGFDAAVEVIRDAVASSWNIELWDVPRTAEKKYRAARGRRLSVQPSTPGPASPS